MDCSRWPGKVKRSRELPVQHTPQSAVSEVAYTIRMEVMRTATTDFRTITAGRRIRMLAASAACVVVLSSPLFSSAAQAGFFRNDVSAPEVADMLYTRYRVARVMSIITVGDVYHADAIDRRGYRIRFIVDGDNGAVLDSFMVGRSAYEAPVPIPPGLVPNGQGARLAPFGPGPDRLTPPEPARPAPRRQPRTPEPDATINEPAKPETAPTLRAPAAPPNQEPRLRRPLGRPRRLTKRRQ